MLLIKPKYINPQSGQSLVEVVVAVGLIVLTLTALVRISVTSIAQNRLAKERTVATRLAQEGVEWLRQERDRLGWMAFNNEIDVNTYCLNTFPAGGVAALTTGPCAMPFTYSNTAYTREVRVNAERDTDGDASDDEVMDLTVRVSWDFGNQNPDVIVDTTIGNKGQ